MITESSLNVFCKKLNRRDWLQNCHFPDWDFHKSSIISRDSQHTPAMDPAAPVAFLIKEKAGGTGIDANEGDFFPELKNSQGHLRFPDFHPSQLPAVALEQGGCFPPQPQLLQHHQADIPEKEKPQQSTLPSFISQASPSKAQPKSTSLIFKHSVRSQWYTQVKPGATSIFKITNPAKKTSREEQQLSSMGRMKDTGDVLSLYIKEFDMEWKGICT